MCIFAHPPPPGKTVFGPKTEKHCNNVKKSYNYKHEKNQERKAGNTGRIPGTYADNRKGGAWSGKVPQDPDAFLLAKGEGWRTAKAKAKGKSETETNGVGGNRQCDKVKKKEHRANGVLFGDVRIHIAQATNRKEWRMNYDA